MTIRSLFFLLFLFTYSTYSQYSDWQSITNMNDITDMAIYDDNIIVASDGGAYIYNIVNESIQKFTNIEGLNSVDLVAVEVDNNGNVIFASSRGNMQVYNPAQKSWKNIRFDGSDINDLTIANDTLWLASDDGAAVFLYRDGEWEYSDFFLNFPQVFNSIKTIALFDEKVWMATDIGLLSAPSNFNAVTLTDPQNWTLLTTQNGLPANNIISLEIFQNKLWIGTTQGLASLKSVDSMITASDFDETVDFMYSSNQFLHIIVDKNHYMYDGITVSLNSSFDREIKALLIDEDDVFWYGIYSAGLRNSQNDQLISISGPIKSYVRFVLKDSNGRIWASTGKQNLIPNEGYSVYENETWVGYDYGGNGWYDLGNTTNIYEDRFKNIWFGSWGGGVQVLTANGYKFFHNHSNAGNFVITTPDTVYNSPLNPIGDEFKNYLIGADNGLEDYEVITAFKEDLNGNMWIANSFAKNGLYLAAAPYDGDFVALDPQEWVYFGNEDGISLGNQTFTALDVDIFGRIWVGTFNDGIFIIDYNNTLSNKNDDQVFSLRVADGLNSNVVLTLACGNDGIVWIGTAGGLNSFDGNNVYNHIGDSDGINGPILSSSSSINSIAIDDYNNKWIATEDGLTILESGRTGFEPQAWKSYDSDNSGLLNNLIHSISIDQNNSQVLLGTESGISIFEGSFAEIQNNFDQVVAGPNPFNISANINFTIRKLKSNSVVKIFNIHGRLVKKLTPVSNLVEGGRATWDGKDSNGNNVASGIYFFQAFTEDGKAFSGKVAVINN